MSSEVPFVRVVPEEIERYGFAGATFVAHIRYRCATDGPGRFVGDGVRWWQVPLADLAAELHVSKDVAQRTMKRLGDAVAARRSKLPGDQTRAYHVPAYDVALTTQYAESRQAELPERDSASVAVDRRGIAPIPTRNRTGTDAESRSVPLSGEGEEGEEGRYAAAPPTAPDAERPPANSEAATPDLGDYRDDPPEDQPGPFAEAAAATAAPPRIAKLPLPLSHWPKDYPEPEPPERCPAHADWDTSREGRVPSCPPCGDARKAHQAWAADRKRWRAERHQARRLWCAECDECDDPDDGGWIKDPYDELPMPLQCPHAPIWAAWWRYHLGRPRCPQHVGRPVAEAVGCPDCARADGAPVHRREAS